MLVWLARDVAPPTAVARVGVGDVCSIFVLASHTIPRFGQYTYPLISPIFSFLILFDDLLGYGTGSPFPRFLADKYIVRKNLY